MLLTQDSRTVTGDSSTDTPVRAMPTRAAARYLGISVSMLRKFRLGGRDDPGLKGPDFIRISRTLVVYERTALDRWLDERAGRSAI